MGKTTITNLENFCGAYSEIFNFEFMKNFIKSGMNISYDSSTDTTSITNECFYAWACWYRKIFIGTSHDMGTIEFAIDSLSKSNPELTILLNKCKDYFNRDLGLDIDGNVITIKTLKAMINKEISHSNSIPGERYFSNLMIAKFMCRAWFDANLSSLIYHLANNKINRTTEFPVTLVLSSTIFDLQDLEVIKQNYPKWYYIALDGIYWDDGRFEPHYGSIQISGDGVPPTTIGYI